MPKRSNALDSFGTTPLMYIRWKTRRTMGRDEVALTAILLESRRIDGQPRQKYLAGLGTLRVQQQPLAEHFAEVHGGFAYIWRVIRFWNKIAGCLDDQDLDADQRLSIESEIASRIPKPTDAQRLANEAGMEAMRSLSNTFTSGRRRRRLTALRVRDTLGVVALAPKAQRPSSSLSREADAMRERDTQGCAQTSEDEL